MNKLVKNRLRQIQKILIDAHAGGSGMASSSIGAERESFINLVLGNVIAPPFRVGTGEITNPEGKKSGQVDIVVEYASSLSFPLLRGDSSRLYLAEGISAVIEVKSDVRKQWAEVVSKAQMVRSVVRDPGILTGMNAVVPNHIPFFVVGFTGWAKSETVAKRIAEQRLTDGPVDGVLVIDSGIYRGREPRESEEELGYSDHNANGPSALYGFLLSIEQLTSGMVWAKPAYKSYIDGE